jgi:hypothetical protein
MAAARWPVLTAIVKREQRGRHIVRHLDCGHTQRQHSGSEAQTALEAYCRLCATRAKNVVPVDTRTELQRLADAVVAVYTFPTRAWSPADTAVRRLVDACRKHNCTSAAHSEAA